MTSTRGSLRCALAASALGLVLLASSPGRAQGAGGNDKVAAEALFEQARGLMTDGKFADACPKFADSQRLDPSPGTLLNLASCYEKLGRTATAWATYREAASAANAAGRADYVTTAQRHADALAPKLAKLTATVTQPVDGLQVKRDGVDVARSAWGVPLPIDTGSHAIEASAPGYKSWSATVDVPSDGAQVSVTVPALEAAPAAVAPPPPVTPPPAAPPPTTPAGPPPDASTGSTQRLIGLVIGGVGVVGLGVGGAFALIAKGKNSDSLNNCETTNPNLCTSDGVNARNQALNDANAATVAVSVGAAALVGGAIIWLTAPSAPSPSSGRLVVAPTLGGAVVQGAW